MYRQLRLLRRNRLVAITDQHWRGTLALRQMRGVTAIALAERMKND